MTIPKRGNVFIVDDEVELMTALCEVLTEQGYDARGFASASEALARLQEQDIDLLLCDLMMPEMDGITLLQAALDIDPNLVGIIMTGQGTIQTAVEAMKVGAFDYVLKPFRLQTLLPVLARAQQVRRLRLENLQLRETMAIYELEQAIAYTLDVQAILDKVIDGTMQQVGAAEASILLPTPDGEGLYIAAVRGEGREALLGQRTPLEQSIAGWVARNRQPLTLHGMVNDPRFVLPQPRPELTAMVLPMLAGGHLMGVLNVNATNRRRPFTLGQMKALSILANLAAAALTNASLYAQVQQSEERFRSVAESATDAIILADSSGAIISWNPSAQTLFGYAPDEIVGQPITLLMPERCRGACMNGLKRVVATEQLHLARKPVELHGLTKDGREFPIELSLSSWRTAAGAFFSVIIRDITERKQTEKELQQQREATYQAEKLATMGQLLAGVAHELNNPLTVVLGHAFLLQQDASSGRPAAYTQEIMQAANRCVRIVRNFLSLARQHPIERSQTHLNQVVQEAVELLAYQLRVDTVEVHLHLADDLPPLWADPHQLHQVVVNLITNAHQAMRETATPRHLTLTTQYNPVQHRVCLEVADTGPGIPPEIQARIFEPFFTTKPPGVGTGLGLSLCRGMIEGHGGSIEVESPPGQSTVFRVELPVEAPPATVLPPPTSEILPPLQGKSILVVDDEPQIADVLVQTLSNDGQHVETATDGVMALDKLQRHTYDLILSDLRMPAMDGPGLYREAERHYPGLERRIIFLTGDTMSSQTRAFLEQTRVPCLPKPFSLQEVRQVVQRVLRATQDGEESRG
jgi:PAS domain S-box-containing protein